MKRKRAEFTDDNEEDEEKEKDPLSKWIRDTYPVALKFNLPRDIVVFIYEFVEQLDLFKEFIRLLARNDPSEVLPAKMWNRLFEYQKRLLRWMISCKGRCYEAFDPGLGKTYLTICASVYFQILHKDVFPMLIIAGNKFKFQWKDEWLKNGGMNKNQFNKLITVVTSQTAVNREAELKAKKFNTVILDEVHRVLSNTEVLFYKGFYLLLQSCNYLYECSGTSCNKHADLFAALNCLSASIFSDRTRYEDEYCGRRLVPKFRGSTEKRWDCSRSTNVTKLRKMMNRAGYRYGGEYLRTLLGPLAEATRTVHEHDVILKPAPEHKQRFYAGLQTPEEVREDLRIGGKSFLEQFNRVYPFKIAEVCQFLETDKVFGTLPTIVFTMHSMMSDAIERICIRRNIKYARVDGATRGSDDLIRQFQDPDSGVMVAITSIKACAVGLNMTRAQIVYNAEWPWDYGDDKQRRCRYDRTGQKNTVNVYNLLKFDNFSFDRVLIGKIRDKRHVFERVNGIR